MSAPMRTVGARLLPNGWLDCVRQFALFAAAYYAYRLVRGAVDGKVATAFQHATDVIYLEQKLHAFIEPSVQSWATSQRAVIDWASWMYLHSHFTITLSALVFIYMFRNDSFYFVRNMFMIAMTIALIGYLVYPTAPPRLLPYFGFEDSVARFTGIPADTASSLYNPYAAMPSMHVAFALMVGLPLARLVKSRWLKVLWRIYPLLVTFIVVATGNHFVTDAVFGALAAGVSAWISQALLARARPHAWAFQPTVGARA